MMTLQYAKSRRFLLAFVSFLLLGLFLFWGSSQAQAQAEGAVKEVTGTVEPDRGLLYILPDLKRGDTLYLHATATSGNLDPFVGIIADDVDRATLSQAALSTIQNAVAEGFDPVIALKIAADDLLLAWDDDSGEGYDAALAYEILANGTYQMTVGGSLGQGTFGDYRLLVGINAPDVLTGNAEERGELEIVFDRQETVAAVQEISGTLSIENPSTFFVLDKVEQDDTLYAYLEATSGDLAPVLYLEDFGGKILRVSNYSGAQSNASGEYTFPADGANYQLRVEACCAGDERSEGNFRLLVGRNTPGVLEGKAIVNGPPVLLEASPVRAGIKMDQITGVDQKSENFGVVANMRFEWQDPLLAFSPDSCDCSFKTFTDNSFTQYAAANNTTWPEWVLFNQQGRRDSQGQTVVVFPDGRAIYYERFTATLQAPDFDFRRFPFDTQEFFIRVQSVFPEELYVYEELPRFSGLGDQLGEEEWVLTTHDTSIDTLDSGQARYNFRFEAHRHLTFYIFRIFVPVLLIIIVAWFTFFLRDYSARISATSGNLLVFVAFNFTISGELPRLGYLTYIDTILIATFIVSALVIVLNVYLKRLEVAGQVDRARKIDRYVIWIYPLAYLIGGIIVTLIFFL